jgi:tetratricopeptide (TPR) repeat protein
MSSLTVNAWEEKVIIPTYGVGKPNKNPMFFEKRVYQGSSGVVYPNPVIEKIFDEKYDREYTALFLENKYIKVMILPELGGRIQMAFDKIKQRHFVYYNQVIKPALVGLTGPWISGGIEFNWPQHHRPSTFEPVDYKLEENADGSKTVWLNEIEKMFHTKGMAGFTLYPDKAFIEIKAKLYNGSDLPQTFLWWANPAVKVNDHYQSVFPPDVNAVFDHGKRDVSTFPIATGTYYKVDYSPGTDISRYKNIPVPTSYMAINSDYDFVGGYEHDSGGGLLHVANHHVSPGKKQWTWGHSDFGKAWDRNLTDKDGPYIELMTGVFTDNQPDFSWLMPHEQKFFTQYFMPYRELGVVKNATRDVMLSVSKTSKGITLKAFATSLQVDCLVKLSYNNDVLFSAKHDLKPEEVFETNIAINGTYDESLLFISISSAKGELIRYEPALNKKNEIPQPAKPALAPADVENNEQLFLTAQHLEQYRHATYSPVPYYEEALRRDPKDIRNNNALGAWYLRRGKFSKAEAYLRKAIETSISRNPNPYDSEPYYNLGLCLKYLNRNDEAYPLFYKATWSSAWKDNGFFAVAQIDMMRGNYQPALEHISAAIDNNANNNKAYVVNVAALRKLGRYEEAAAVVIDALRRDSFNLGVMFESRLLSLAIGQNDKAEDQLNDLKESSKMQVHNILEYAFDYAAFGAYQEATEILATILSADAIGPMECYSLAWFAHKAGNKEDAGIWLDQAATVAPYLCFPNRLSEIAVLEYAMEANPGDAMPAYYLGNLFYDKRQYDRAIALWERAADNNDTFPTLWRNLGLAYFNKRNDEKKALACYEKAFTLDQTDARVLMELDQLYKRLNRSPGQRLAILEEHLATVIERDDLYLERVSLYNLAGEYKIALQLIMDRKFHPWEGGEGKVTEQYVQSLLGLAVKHYYNTEYAAAIDLLARAQKYPHNLGEGKLFGTQENDIFYWLGCAYQGLNDDQNANRYFGMASIGLEDPKAAVFYNDQKPDKMVYQGLALQKLGQEDKADALFKKLIAYGLEHMNDEVKIDYFAVSLPDLLIFDDDLNLRNRLHSVYLQGLGHLGLRNYIEANKLFQQVLNVNASHLGSKTHHMLATALGTDFNVR